MAKFVNLYSSSKGNSSYAGNSAGGILIDVGKSYKFTKESLQRNRISLDDIKAIFITHEHSDHICGLRVFLNQKKVPVFATQGTLNSLLKKGILNNKDEYYDINSGTEICNMQIIPFATSHDSAESCGYKIVFRADTSFCVATDTGIITDDMREKIIGCNGILLETNYDDKMLYYGYYPRKIKDRISSNLGHLSNYSAAKFAFELLKSNTTRFILGHLSENNNLPELSFDTVTKSLCTNGAREKEDYLIDVASSKFGSQEFIL
ncbi:MAG: MBL fold metallo-hydrolase [Clostridia bacterium]|nr:MBL fold metallo-hydrolase [Clostridia bacterium]